MNKASGNFIDREVERTGRATRGFLSGDELVVPFGGRTPGSMAETLRECVGNPTLLQTVAGLAEQPKKRPATVEAAEPAPLAAAREFVKKGVALWKQGRDENALDTFDQVVARFGDSEVLELRGIVAIALVNKGTILCDLNRLKEALTAYDQVLQRLDGSREPELLELVANAIVNKSAALIGLRRADEALAACDEVLHRFEGSQSQELLATVAHALVNKGIALGALDRSEEALTAFDEMLRRFGDSEARELLEPVASALVRKGVALGTLSRPEEALAVSEEVLHRFDHSDMPGLVEEVANALTAKGIALSALNRPEEALIACDEALRRFSETDTIESPQRVAPVLVNKSIVLAKLGLPSQSRDVAALLDVLPKIDSPQIAMGVLLVFSIDHGPKQMRELIEASPAAELLRSLTTAMEMEMCLDPQVPEEVFEKAKDIQQDLAKMTKTLQAVRALSNLQREAVRRGLDQLTMDEIDEEIQAFRRGRKND